MATTYRCWIPEYGQEREDGRDVRDAWDVEMAACIFIEQYEARSAEYTVASGAELTIAVSADGSEPVEVVVWGEARPQYHARRRASTHASGAASKGA